MKRNRKTRTLLCVLLACLSALVSCTPGQDTSPATKVFTDDSQLEKRVPLTPIGTRFYEEYTPELLPRTGYGRLIAYAGARLADDWPAETGCLYGLMNEQGVAVTDPVFASVYAPWYYDGYGMVHYPCLVLKKGGPPEEDGELPIAHCALAAANGSFCTPFDYLFIVGGKNCGLMLIGENSFTTADGNGKLLKTRTYGELGMTDEQFRHLLSSLQYGEGPGGDFFDDYFCLGWADREAETRLILSAKEGTTFEVSQEEWQDLWDENHAEKEEYRFEIKGGETVITIGSDSYPIPFGEKDAYVFVQDNLVWFPYCGRIFNLAGEEVLSLGDGWQLTRLENTYDDGKWYISAIHTDAAVGWERRVYDSNFRRLPYCDRKDASGWKWYYSVEFKGDLVEVLELNSASYYNLETGECVFRRTFDYDV